MFARIALTIRARSVQKLFSYRIPTELEPVVKVGCAVVVSFGTKEVVGYVLDVVERLEDEIEQARIKPVTRVVTDSLFSLKHAKLICWMANEYACSYYECIRLFLPPGYTVRLSGASHQNASEVEVERVKEKHDDIYYLSDKGKSFEPKKHARVQAEIIRALQAGPLQKSELQLFVKNCTSALKSLENKGIVCKDSNRVFREYDGHYTLSSAQASAVPTLTHEQAYVLEVIENALKSPDRHVILVDGVTGSGKTEVYMQAIQKVTEQNKSAILLIPEISLTAQTVGRLRSRFKDSVAIVHSGLSLAQRFDQWDKIRQGKAKIVVGARSALFAPVQNLSLVIIDEEHEYTYKQENCPRYHAREVAQKLCEIEDATLVLGSATPSLESFERCEKGVFRGFVWTRVQMKKRSAGAKLPEVEVVDMRTEFKHGHRSIFSRKLIQELKTVVENKQKAIFLLNRRGFASFLMCLECGCVPECPHCALALTYHKSQNTLECHSCGQMWKTQCYPNPATQCPNCKSRYLAQYGIGTERVEEELRALVGDVAHIVRIDRDNTKTKNAHEKLLEEFDSHPCAVLIGTQMIAKGLDFPEVTLVGVINADTVLKLPDFRAGERTFGLLEQVAGRAGRGKLPGKVIVQTYWPTHPAIFAVAKHKRESFIEKELADRKELYYPPFSRLSNVVVSDRSETVAKNTALKLGMVLRDITQNELGYNIMGPVDCVRFKIKDRFRFHILIKSPINSHPASIIDQALEKADIAQSTRVSVDVDCYDVM